MKKIAVNILCSTGITLITLAILGALFGATRLFISSVFESFLCNLVIHIGLFFTQKFESRYAVLEYALDIGYVVAVVTASGAVFNWYRTTPLWILLTMSAMVYLAGVLLSIFRLRQDIDEINRLLQKRNNPSDLKETLL